MIQEKIYIKEQFILLLDNIFHLERESERIYLPRQMLYKYVCDL
jgi:hypothetical protein